MFNIFKAVFHAFFGLSELAAKSVYKIIRGVLTALLAVPAAAVDTLSRRLMRCVEQLRDSLDNRDEKRKQRSEEEYIAAALEQLYYADNPVISGKQLKQIKNLLILILQFVSFFTTYHGLVQTMSSLHYAVPLLLSLVIQIGLGYLAVAATHEGSSRGQKFLLACFFLCSFSFSYMGVAESRIPYATYAKEQYTPVFHAYRAAHEAGKRLVESGSNPSADLEGQYRKMEQVLSDAQTRYSDDELQRHRDLLDDYQGKQKAVTVENPVTYVRGEDGSVIPTGGGTSIAYVTDSEFNPKIEEEQETIAFIEEQRRLISEINQLLSGAAAQDRITAVMEKQIASSSGVLREFTIACDTFRMLADKTNMLAERMGVPITVEPELQTVLQSYHFAQAIQNVQQMPAFDELYTQWKETEFRPAKTGFETLDDLLAKLSVNNPTLLKESLDQTVSDSYYALNAALQYIGEENYELTEAFHAYDLLDPLAYALTSLLPSGSNARFMGAIIALVIALANDGLAVLIGFLMEHRCVPWTDPRTITAQELISYLYPHFRKVIMPAIRKRLKSTFTFEMIRDAYIELLSEYLDKFVLHPMLVREGYTRYLKVTNSSPEFDNFCAFLLTWDLARPVSPEDLVTLSVMSTPPEGHYILLTSRAEGWLTDLIGSAADLGFNELHAE